MYFSTGSQLSSALASLSASKVGQFLAFDALYYSNTYMLNGNTTALTAIEHFVQIGAPAMAKPNATFDPVYYKQHYADLTGTNLDAADLLYHFMQFGLDEGRLPSADLAGKFNATAYLAAYPDVAAYVNANLASFGGSASNGALAHYVKFGMAQGFTLPVAADAGTTFELNATTVLGSDGVTALDIMRLTGDSNVRIDLTGNDNQIKGLDLDGDGVGLNGIEANGIENVNPTTKDDGKDFEIVNAYATNRANESDIAGNFLGNIAYDGTGFAGDGVSTDGNIVLGGLGADTILGGIGNDFLVGGGVATANGGFDRLEGGRNADFFFGELSLLDNTDGNGTQILAGSTTDDSAVGNNTPQDSDWLLLEVSDDEDGAVVDLSNSDAGAFAPLALENDQSVVTGSGQVISMKEIENVDASGNLYGFLNKVAVSLGGAGSVVTNDEGTLQNVGIGSSAQLHIMGSVANNILIGGFDNDRIEGAEGSDLLFGGNLNYNNNTNLAGIVNNGMDEIYGGDGADNIVFEADGGIIEGDNTLDANGDLGDTLWLTREALGTGTADSMIADAGKVLRFDLGTGHEGGIDAFNGYGGADAGGNGADALEGTADDYTADQTNYTDEASRVKVQDMENVIATGLGAVDYRAAGMNDPELNFNNQQNHRAYNGNLDLRGTNGVNTLYAAGGIDTVEGREGNDLLSGGNLNDNFVFQLTGASGGDGVDVIHRQLETAANSNLWAGTFGQDFGVLSSNNDGKSYLIATFPAGVDLTDPNVGVTQFQVTIDGVVFGATLTAASLSSLETTTTLAAALNTSFHAQNDTVSVEAVDAFTLRVVVNKPDAVIGTNLSTGTVIAGTAVGAPFQVNPSLTFLDNTLSGDHLIYQAYEDRADGEKVDDSSLTGSTVSLGIDSYAQDLVIDFAAADYDINGDGLVNALDVDTAGTRIAEDQSYDLTFDNLTTEDHVSISVNGVTYSLTVGIDLDGNELADEELVGQGGTAADQATIQSNFLDRMELFIDTFMDNDTASGSVDALAIVVGGKTVGLTLTQNAYSDTEETVYMRQPTVTLTNASGGEAASWEVVNVSQHDVQLLDFDGRNGLLNKNNVLFLGDSTTSRSILSTAANTLTAGTTTNTIAGSEASVIDGGTNTLQAAVVGTAAAIFDNTATNALLRTDFSVHGDDLLIGGNVKDTIEGGTGDDRILGSLGNDVVNGGKSYYAVKVLGEAQARVYVLNQWEAEHPTDAASPLKAALAGFTLSSINHIGDNQSGVDAIDNTGTEEVFSDTLQFAQRDFNAGSSFTVTLTDTTLNAAADATNRILQQKTGGTGTVIVNNNDGGTAVDATTTFSEMEHIRTVSGTGNAVADDGQGTDTLNVTALSTAVKGISYDLTNRVDGAGGIGAGKVSYSSVGNPGATPASADYDTLVIKVDGVESVIGGTGNDLLMIDETEAAKDNSFDAGTQLTGATQTDRIEYLNDYGTDDAEPTVTIRVNNVDGVATANTDTVEMTGGRVGTTVAVDTLIGVERIALNGNTAEGKLEKDVLDVTEVTDAIVNYVDGTVKTGATTHVIITGIAEIENVYADGDDTVIVADAAAMSGANARSDATAAFDVTDGPDLELLTYLDYDNLDGDLARIAFTNQIEDDIHNAVNFGQYTFDLSYTGDGEDMDRVDYHNANDQIVAVIDLVNADDTNYVLVSGSGDSDSFSTALDRVDVLVDVEQVVASMGESVLDFTGAETAVNVRYAKISTGTARTDIDSQETIVTIENRDTSVPYTAFGYVELYDLNTGTITTGVNANWSRVEGSDEDEYIELTSDQNAIVHTFNLRGGDNEVNYNELQSTGIEVSIQDLDVTAGGMTSINVQAKDNANNVLNAGDNGAGAGGVAGDGVVNGTETWTQYDRITSYNGYNETSGGTLRIEASQSEDDSINLDSVTDNNLIVLGQTEGLDDIVTIALSNGDANVSLTLTGFETLLDGAGDDTYTVEDLTNFLNTLTLSDNALADFDTLNLLDGALENYTGAGGSNWADGSIELTDLEATLPYDFQALDISEVTEQIDYVVGTDEVLVLGSLVAFGDQTDANVEVQGFQTIKFTSTTGMGSDLVVDMDLGEFRQADGTVLFTFDSATTFDFSAITTDMEVAVVDVGGVGVTIIGDAVDTFTGAEGDDVLVGGASADDLDGGVIPEALATLTFTLSAGTLGSGATTGVLTIDNPAGGAVRITETGLVEGSVIGDFSDAVDITPITGGVADNASAAAIATVLGHISLANWNTYLGAISGGAFSSVSFDVAAGAVEMTFTANTAAGDLAAADLTMAISGGNDVADGTIAVNGVLPTTGNVAATNAGNGVDYSAEQNSADTFVLFAGDTGTTVATADSIANWDATDALVIVTSEATGTYTEAAAADFAAAVTAADLDLLGGDMFSYQYTPTTGYLFIDADADGEADGLVVLPGAGAADMSDANLTVGLGGTSVRDVLDLDSVTDDLVIVGLGGFDSFTMAYSGAAASSVVTTGSTPASGFDTIYANAGDALNLSTAVDAAEALMVVGAVNPATTSGNDLITALNTAFQANDDGAANYEAMLIQFVNGDQYLVVDGGSQSIAGNNDVVIQIVGTVTGLTLDGEFNVVIG